jgi:hypothetical protein
MKTLVGVLFAAATYLLAGLLLVLVVHALLPDETDAQGHVTGRATLALDLCANAIASFLAGAVASGGAGGAATSRRLVIPGALFGIAALGTLAFWSATPAWYNEAILATTPLFAAIGLAWREALRGAAPSIGAP